MDVIKKLNILKTDFNNDEVVTQCKMVAREFYQQNQQLFEFSSILNIDDHAELLCLIFDLFEKNGFNEELKLNLLSVLRLLSRDRKLVLSIKDIGKCIQSFVKYFQGQDTHGNNVENDCVIEVLRCICNWVYHSKPVRDFLLKIKLAENLIKNMKTFILNDHLYFKLRLIFLMSAHENEFRLAMVECSAMSLMLQIIQKIISQAKNSNHVMDAQGCKIFCEVFRASFNITLALQECSSDGTIESCSSLVLCCTEVLHLDLHKNAPEDIVTPIVHLMVNLPKACLEKLCPPVSTENNESLVNDQKVFKEHDMTSVIILLKELRERIKIQDYSKMKEKTMAILTAFSYICRDVPLMRKYLRGEVLPPLSITKERPEERQDACGDIVRLMTTVDVMLKNMAADFLFVLCKENTERLIRYTGYGNSAGFLATRGLMVPGRHVDGDYSEDELTDVDDEQVDVTTGAMKEEKPSPLDSMTEEEKEIEAEKLMHMFERLKELNAIKPMTVTKDGKLVEFTGPKDDE
eukprot:TCONS_00068176-protein